MRLGAVREAIRLEGVTFSYPGREPALRGVDLEIPAGRTTAIVGESGSGKSTVLRLLARLAEPDAGRVRFDGIDAHELDLDAFRSRLGVVTQSPALFSGSVRENVLLGAEETPPEILHASVRRAGLEPVLELLPEGLDEPLGERGTTLSGGQRQRIALARALVRRPALLLLDEATSQLDTVTERVIQRGLAGLDGSMTSVVVAHRLSTVCHADRIYVMHDGAVCECGTHGELLAMGGRYASLWRAQTEGGESDRAPTGRTDAEGESWQRN